MSFYAGQDLGLGHTELDRFAQSLWLPCLKHVDEEKIARLNYMQSQAGESNDLLQLAKIRYLKGRFTKRIEANEYKKIPSSITNVIPLRTELGIIRKVTSFIFDLITLGWASKVGVGDAVSNMLGGKLEEKKARITRWNDRVTNYRIIAYVARISLSGVLAVGTYATYYNLNKMVACVPGFIFLVSVINIADVYKDYCSQ